MGPQKHFTKESKESPLRSFGPIDVESPGPAGEDKDGSSYDDRNAVIPGARQEDEVAREPQQGHARRHVLFDIHAERALAQVCQIKKPDGYDRGDYGRHERNHKAQKQLMLPVKPQRPIGRKNIDRELERMDLMKEQLVLERHVVSISPTNSERMKKKPPLVGWWVKSYLNSSSADNIRLMLPAKMPKRGTNEALMSFGGTMIVFGWSTGVKAGRRRCRRRQCGFTKP